GGDDRQDRPAGAEPASERVGRAVVERVHRVPRASAGRHGALELLDAAERRAEDDGDARGLRRDRGARQEILGRRQQELRGTAPDASAAWQRPKLLDLTAAPDPQIVDGEALDRGDAVAAGDESRPESVEVAAERGNRAGSDEADGLSAQARDSGHRSSWAGS